MSGIDDLQYSVLDTMQVRENEIAAEASKEDMGTMDYWKLSVDVQKYTVMTGAMKGIQDAIHNLKKQIVQSISQA